MSDQKARSVRRAPTLTGAIFDMAGAVIGLVALVWAIWLGPIKGEYAQATFNLVLGFFLLERTARAGGRL